MRHRTAVLAAAASVLSAAAVCAGLGDQLFKVLPSDGAASDFFGQSIAISGPTAIIGAREDDDNGVNSGSAYLIDASTGAQLLKLMPGDGAAGDFFGESVAISGTTAIVGARFDDDRGVNSGSAYLFDTTTGAQLFKLVPNDGAPRDQFGVSVAIWGTTAIVGSWADDDNGTSSGSAYLFDTTTGQQIAKLLAGDGAMGDRFGRAVAVTAGTAIVGAIFDDDNGSNSGSAYLFDTATGAQTAKLLPIDGAAVDHFGQSVAISGQTAIVGANLSNANSFDSGAAYLFDTATGVQLAKLLPYDGTAGDQFGFSVAISGPLGGEVAIVGAPFDDDTGGRDSGSSYVFDVATGAQLAKLLPLDGAAGKVFGFSVTISDATALVGAPFDDDNGNLSGSAYIYEIYSAPASDTTPPEVACELVPVDVEEDEGLFQVVFSVTDDADPDPLVLAVLTCGDLEVEVSNGELVKIELDGESEIKMKRGMVKIEGPNPLLQVFAEDASGNSAMGTVAPVFAPDDGYDDDDHRKNRRHRKKRRHRNHRRHHDDGHHDDR